LENLGIREFENGLRCSLLASHVSGFRSPSGLYAAPGRKQVSVFLSVKSVKSVVEEK
jgi:hypothetical protein